MIKEEFVEKNLNKYLQERFFDAIVGDNDEILIYSNFDQEYKKLKNGVVIRNVINKDFYNLYGKDVYEFLHRISTNNVKALNSNEKVETLFLTEKGRMIDDTILLRTDYEAILIANKDSNSRLGRWIERYIISEDVKLNKDSGKYFVLEFWGPQAESYLTLICGKFVDALTYNNVVNVNVEGLIFKLFKNKTVDGRTFFTIIGDMLISTKLIEYLLNHSSVFDLGMVGEAAFDYFRIKKGYAVFPNEINDRFNPHELNLTYKIDDRKGCYIGQEVIARLESYDKIQKKLVGILFEDSNIENNSLILSDYADEVGFLTSICKYKNLKNQLGLAVVKKSKAYNNAKLLAKGDKDYQQYTVLIKEFPIEE